MPCILARTVIRQFYALILTHTHSQSLSYSLAAFFSLFLYLSAVPFSIHRRPETSQHIDYGELARVRVSAKPRRQTLKHDTLFMPPCSPYEWISIGPGSSHRSVVATRRKSVSLLSFYRNIWTIPDSRAMPMGEYCSSVAYSLFFFCSNFSVCF